MNQRFCCKQLSGIVLILLLSACSLSDDEILLDPQSASLIGEKIFLNECGGKRENLTSWNHGEAFPSLGIGHFIWYPKGTSGPFKESFPELIRLMPDEDATIPAWLRGALADGAPWSSREQFLAAQNSPKMEELRTFLDSNRALQVRFMVARLNRALPEMLAATPDSGHARIKAQFHRVASAPMGYYALIDYVNFKGEGTKASERYQGKGWGLLQVLEAMESSGDALQAFAEAADRVLTRRVELSPPEREEQRWLPGWRKRLGTYTATIAD